MKPDQLSAGIEGSGRKTGNHQCWSRISAVPACAPKAAIVLMHEQDAHYILDKHKRVSARNIELLGESSWPIRSPSIRLFIVPAVREYLQTADAKTREGAQPATDPAQSATQGTASYLKREENDRQGDAGHMRGLTRLLPKSLHNISYRTLYNWLNPNAAGGDTSSVIHKSGVPRDHERQIMPEA
jgi:hypothetical protein